MNLPSELRYSSSHEWVRQQDDSTVFIGITDFAQGELGDVVFVDFPKVGASFKLDDALCTLESVKAVSDLYAPVSGEVTAVNQALLENPSLINDDCYSDGWLLALKPEDAQVMEAEIQQLLSADDYRKQVI